MLRQSRDPYQVGVDVLVTSDGQAYRARITRVRQSFGQTYVDVEYEHAEGYNDPTEEWVELTRLTPGLTNSVNTHARAMETVRARNWTDMCG